MKQKKQKSTSQISRVRTNSQKNKWRDESNLSGPGKKISYFYVYLPDGTIKTYSFDSHKDTELGDLLEQLLKSRGNIMYQEVLDLDGRAMDLKKKLRELGTLEVTCIPLKSWIARAAFANIQDYLKLEATSDSALALKVYLPQGRDSQFPLKDSSKFKLVQVLSRIKTKRAELNLSDAIAQDLLGNTLDFNLTVEELDLKEICFGVNIVDWILYVEKEKNNSDLVFKDKKQLIDFFLNLDKLLQTRKEKLVPTSALKSPPRKPIKSTAEISISEQLQNQKLSDPIQPSAQLTAQVSSFWHIQHYELDDEKHIEHYADSETQYKYTYMVPFPFFEPAPVRKKPWEKLELTDSNEDKNDPPEMTPQTDIPSFEEFMVQMDAKMNEKKRNESQAFQVSVVMR